MPTDSLTSSKTKLRIPPVLYVLVGLLCGIFLSSLGCRYNWRMVSWFTSSTPCEGGISHCDHKSIPQDEPNMGMQVDIGGRDMLREQFSTRMRGLGDPEPVVGGRISKCMVNTALMSLADEQEYLHYYFGFDPAINKTVLIIKGGLRDPTDPSLMRTVPLMFRTGLTPDCFCPTMCD